MGRRYSPRICRACNDELPDHVRRSRYCSPECRFMSKVELTDSCWLWTGCLDHRGYGRFRRPGYTGTGAHRAAWEISVGPIPDGLTVDHLCLVPGCVNPDHMEIVTAAENRRRQTLNLKPRPPRTACSRGHALVPENTYRGRSGWPECRICRALNDHVVHTRDGRACRCGERAAALAERLGMTLNV